MYFSKCISQNVFPKMYFSKCIPQNVFPKMYFSKCISQNVLQNVVLPRQLLPSQLLHSAVLQLLLQNLPGVQLPSRLSYKKENIIFLPFLCLVFCNFLFAVVPKLTLLCSRDSSTRKCRLCHLQKNLQSR